MKTSAHEDDPVPGGSANDYDYCSVPGPGGVGVGLRVVRGFNENQRILIQFAKAAKNVGLHRGEAKTLLDWAKEYGLQTSRGIETHSWKGNFPHIRIGPVNHIRVI